MRLDNQQQRVVLLELIARAHRTPEEVVAVEAARKAVAEAEVDEEPETPE